MKKILLTLPVLTALFSAPFAMNAAIVTKDVIQDTFVRSDQADNVQGGLDYLLVGDHASVGPFNSFYEFDLSDSVLTGATINSVTLRLTSIANAGSGTIDVDLFQLSAANSDWVEGGTGASGNGASYNNKDRITNDLKPWASGNTNANLLAGTDYVNTVLGTYAGATNNGTGGQTFDLGNASLASLVQSSLGGNLDLIIMGQTGSNSNFLRIASSENTTYAGPQLIIDYTAAVPEPSTMALYAGFAVLGLILYRRRRQ